MGTVFVINDTFVVENVAKHIEQIKATKVNARLQPFQLVYYYQIELNLNHYFYL
jgi:hypothetical protein